MRKMYLLFVFLISSNLYALSEINYNENYEKIIIPIISSFEHQTFIGSANKKINYIKYTTNPESSKCILILPGKGEPVEKYAELVHSLNSNISKNSFKFFMMDHRGQGRSERLLSKAVDHQKTYVEKFEYYVNDVNVFYQQIISKENCSTLHGLAHSMGTAIMLGFNKEYPGVLDSLSLISPMLKIKTGNVPYAAAYTIAKTNVAVGKKAYYAPGEGDFVEEHNFLENGQTNSKVRYFMNRRYLELNPELKKGGATYNWLVETMEFTDGLRKSASLIRTPMKVYVASDERYSDREEMVNFCKNAEFCELRTSLNSKHELLMEKDYNRTPIILDLLRTFL